MSRPDDARVARDLAQVQQQKSECNHPTDQIMDRPDRSYCRKCGKDVPPLMRNGSGAFEVFPNA